MSIAFALLLGLVQGLTEFLPVSSSAHVQLVESIFHLNYDKASLTAFIATIQLGTEAAVLVFFWKDIVKIVKAWFGSGFSKSPSQDAKMGWLVIFGSMPVVIAGLLFKDAIETSLRNLWIISITLVVFGLILALADRIGAKEKQISELTPMHGLLYGLGQMLAVIPGVSRSGGTISVGLLLGYSREAAARYSFLLAIPAVLASGLYEFAGSYKDLATSDLLITAIATLVSFIVGLAVIKFLLNYLIKRSFAPFIWWRLIVGVSIFIALSAGWINA
ncbi:MAG: undecaprenyl-diphosphatase UppP [Micrococcales bacterium]